MDKCVRERVENDCSVVSKKRRRGGGGGGRQGHKDYGGERRRSVIQGEPSVVVERERNMMYLPVRVLTKICILKRVNYSSTKKPNGR